MKTIQLGGNRFKNHPVRAYALVDDEDYDKLVKFPWSYAHGYARATSAKQFMHREVLSVSDKNTFVDHIDGNKLNNQKANLRIANKSQNMANCKIHSHNKSGFKGVHFENQTKKWRAMIWVNGVKKSLGRFEDIKEAVKTYNDAALRYFGEYARINEL